MSVDFDTLWAKLAARPKRDDTPKKRERAPYYTRTPKPLKTHCKRGHERTPDNVCSTGGCKTCIRMFSRLKRVSVRAGRLAG